MKRLRVLGVSEIWPHRGRPHHGAFVVGQCRCVRPFADVVFLSPRFWSPIVAGSWLKLYQGQRSVEIVQGIESHYPLTPAWPWYFYIIAQVFSMRWSLLCRASRLHARAPFDFVHAHGVVPGGYVGVAIARRLGIPVVVTAYGSDLNLYPRWRHLDRLVRATLARADVVTAVSRPLVDRAAAMGAGRVEWIPIGYDASLFYPASAAPALSERSESKGPAAKTILYAGRLTEDKGLEDLIAAFTEVARRDPEARLRLVGDGPLAQSLRSQASPLGARVEFPGALPHEKVADEMRRASVFCLPSRREGWPASVVEALACGLPVVGTRIEGLGDLLRGMPSARRVEPGDRAALAESLLEALKDSPGQQISSAVRPYEWSRISEQYHRVYGSLVSRDS